MEIWSVFLTGSQVKEIKFECWIVILVLKKAYSVVFLHLSVSDEAAAVPITRSKSLENELKNSFKV